ncbi:L,D-transpeptidase [Longispora albida]|uniref:L,D-transpeptidase n=1 Tax=Longispora albida TaxID=203523 RepID=UPI001FDF63A7|nr:Ig-like domain-containing protein [Longispora albida]
MARRVLIAGVLSVTLTALAACGSGDGDKKPSGSGSGGGTAPASKAAPVDVVPADKATGVAVSAEIEVKGNKSAGVELSSDKGPVKGEARKDGSSWVPAEPLAYDTTYTVKVGGQSTTFTTMSKPGNRVSVHHYLKEGGTYGQAMPIALEFKEAIPKESRAAVEKRLFVTSEPAQVGAWRWQSGTHLEYRPKEYWQPGTKVSMRLGLGGLPLGGGKFGQFDVTSSFSIDSQKRELVVDNASKQMVAMLDGAPVKTMPVSLGKPSKPSFHGKMVIMEKLDKTVFDSGTYGVPSNSTDGYRTDVEFAQRMSWDGQFIHSASWSVADQGVRNVSHGCINMSPENAKWTFEFTKVGDPVTVKNTEQGLTQGNGWTSWDLSWDDFLKGSALPPPAG